MNGELNVGVKRHSPTKWTSKTSSQVKCTLSKLIPAQSKASRQAIFLSLFSKSESASGREFHQMTCTLFWWFWNRNELIECFILRICTVFERTTTLAFLSFLTSFGGTLWLATGLAHLPLTYRNAYSLQAAMGAVRIRHSIREFATKLVNLWILLGGKPKWLLLNFGFNYVMRTAPITF